MSEYTINDRNGETRIEGTITPDPAFNGGTVAGSINVAEPSNLANDLLLVTEPAGYAFNSGTGNVVRVTDGTTNVLVVDAYGEMTLRAPSGQGDPLLSLHSTDHASFLITFNTSGVNVVDATGTQILGATAASFRTSSTELGFYGHAPAVQQVVPLTTPTVQNVIDALLAIGLIVQHD